MNSRTQVGIVAAGPAGLLLGHFLQVMGIDSVIVENRSCEYVIDRVRAGVLEQGTVDLLCAMGVAGGLNRRGLRHEGVYINFDGCRHRVDMAELTSGKAITVYGQNEVVKDLIDARVETGRPLYFDAQEVSVDALDATRPVIRFSHAGTSHELSCDFVAGCDGFHGVCRPSIPAGVLQIYERLYPFGCSESSRRQRRRVTSLCTLITTAASRCSACARRTSRACISRYLQTSRSPTGPTTRSGTRGSDA
jgi:p-hydroxybenzoate 3-monooxygenase